MKEKVDPYLRPLYDALYDMMPSQKFDRMLANGEIEIAPLAFMRGPDTPPMPLSSLMKRRTQHRSDENGIDSSGKRFSNDYHG